MWLARDRAPDALQIRDLPDPVPGTGQVRLLVEAVGVNDTDLGGPAGSPSGLLRVPYSPGHEVSGVVEVVAPGVSNFKEGDSVFALLPHSGYSDRVCVDQGLVFKRLDWMGADDGAVLPLNYASAYVMLMVMGALRRASHVLIHGVECGLGLSLIDVCNIAGAVVFGTADQQRHEALNGRGLAHLFDERKIDYFQAVRELTDGAGLDLVVNLQGGDGSEKQYKLLKSSGRMVMTDWYPVGAGLSRRIGAPWRAAATTQRLSARRLMAETRGILGYSAPMLWNRQGDLRDWIGQIVNWYDEALFRPAIDRTFPLSQAVEAHRYLGARSEVGRVLLKP
jgi:synaptic vesicle membrane protein VAT-1